MMKCDYCGYDNQPDAKYCAFCGVETTFKKATVQQSLDPEYEEYKKKLEKQERRKHWEQVFQAGQEQVPSTKEPPAWRKEEYQTNHVPARQEKETETLGSRIKRMPKWLKIILIILLFSQPLSAVFWFIVWLIYDQSHK